MNPQESICRNSQCRYFGKVAACSACVPPECDFCGAPDAAPVLFYGLSPHYSDSSEGFKTHLLCKKCESERQIYCTECKERTNEYVEGTMTCAKCAAKDHTVFNCNGCGKPFAPQNKYASTFCSSCFKDVKNGRCVECKKTSKTLDNTGRCDYCADSEIG